MHNTTISQYDLKGRKIREFPNIKAAAKSIKAQQDRIRLAVLGQAHIVKGYCWKLGKGEMHIDITAILEKRLEKLRKSICRQVTQYDLNGNKIANYTSVTQAARSLNIHPMNINDVLKRNPNNTCNGFLWRYGNGPQKIKISDIVQRKKLFLDLSAKPVTQYNLEGRRVRVYSSLKEAARKNKYDRSQILYVVTGQCYTYKDYYWCIGKGNVTLDQKVRELAEQRRLARLSKPVIQYDLTGKKLNEYSSLTEASREQNTAAGYIAQVANGKYKKAKGYIWKWKS